MQQILMVYLAMNNSYKMNKQENTIFTSENIKNFFPLEKSE